MLLTFREEILVVCDYESRYSPNTLYKRVVRMRRGNQNTEKVDESEFVLQLLMMVEDNTLSRWRRAAKKDRVNKTFVQVHNGRNINPLKNFFRLTVMGHEEQMDIFDDATDECNNFRSLCTLRSEWNSRKKQGQS